MSALAGDALRRTGSLRLAADATERDDLRREYDALVEDGFEAEWLDPLPAHLDGLFAGGFVHPGDGALVPALWVGASPGTRPRRAPQIVEHAPVDREAIDDIDAAAVVIAVDGMTHALVPELAPWVTPMRGQVLATEPLPIRYDKPHYSRGGYDYWQQTPDGRLILGGRRDTDLENERTSSEDTTPLIQDQLTAYAAELMGRPPGRHPPLGRGLGRELRRASVRGPSARLRPRLGRGRLLRPRKRPRVRVRRPRGEGHPR